MVDDSDDDSTTADSIDNHLDLQASAVTSDYKVLGQFTSDTGVGVLGQNDAGSGTPIGVQGAVPNASASGYGLYTDHRAKVGGTLELGTLGGSIVGGAAVDDLTGPGLATGSNTLRIGSGAITTAMLGKNGASGGQTFVWDGSNSKWTTGSVSGSGKWADSDNNSLLETSGSETGIEVTEVRTDTLKDNGSGAVAAGASVDLNGNVLQDGSTIIWDASSKFIPDTALQNDSVTVAGNQVSLGGSTDIFHSDLSALGSSDHHTRPSAGDGLTDDSNSFNIAPSDFAGNDLRNDGVDNLELDTPFTRLDDLFGSPVETNAPIVEGMGNPLKLLAYSTNGGMRALAMVRGSDDIPSEGNGTSLTPNVIAGHPNNNTGGAGPSGATVCGGGSASEPNRATASKATVCGGVNNTASGSWSSVLGGLNNTASGFRSVAAGSRAAAEDSGAVVISDGTGYHSIPNTTDDGLSSSTAVSTEPVTGGSTFSVSAAGGVRFITSSTAVTYIDSGSTGWSNTSSRARKTDIEPVDTAEILDGVRDMEVATWEYEGENGEGSGTRQVGPMAEDFHEVVDLGSSDEHINSVDADGVAFAAIQGLADRVDATRTAGKERDERLDEHAAKSAEQAERIEELEAETAALRAENEQLREHLAGLEERLATLEAGGDAGAASAAD